MLHLRVKKSTGFVLFLLLACGNTLTAQVGSNYFEAGPTNIYDWRSSLINPAISALQTGAFEVGYKAFQVGFGNGNDAPLQAGYAILNMPRRLPKDIGFGLQSQTFRSMQYNETGLRFLLNRNMSSLFAVGVSFGFLNVAYDKEHFSQDRQPNDPVFADGYSFWRPDINLGITFTPTNALIIGIGIEHVNNPSVTLAQPTINPNSANQLKPAITFGINYVLGSASFHTSSKKDQTSFTPRSTVQLRDEQLGFVQAGIDKNAARVLARLNVSGPFAVGYGVNYPIGELAGNGFGNHEVSFVYEFDKIVRGVNIGEVPNEWQANIPEMPRIRIAPQFMVLADAPTVDIISKFITRNIEDLDSIALSKLTKFDLGLSDDSLTSESPFLDGQLALSETDTTNGYYDRSDKIQPGTSLADSAATQKGGFQTSAFYLGFLDSLGKTLNSDRRKKAIIITRNQQLNRAQLIRNYMTLNHGVPEHQFQIKKLADGEQMKSDITIQIWKDFKIPKYDTVRVASPESVELTVFPIDSSMHNRPWLFVVEDSSGNRIFTKEGQGDEKQSFVWHWIDATKTNPDSTQNIISHGFYRYYVEWRDGGEIWQSGAQFFYAREIRSTIVIGISKDFPGEIERKTE